MTDTRTSPETERAQIIKLIRCANVTIHRQWEGSTGYVSEVEAARLADAILAGRAGLAQCAPEPAARMETAIKAVLHQNDKHGSNIPVPIIEMLRDAVSLSSTDREGK